MSSSICASSGAPTGSLPRSGSRHLLLGLGLRAFAALIATFGLLMLELAAYFALVQIWSAIAAANFGRDQFRDRRGSFSSLLTARRRGRDIELANEIHASSVEGLLQEARGLQSQVTGMIHHPLNGLLPVLLVPLIRIIIKSLKSGGPAASAAASETKP